MEIELTKENYDGEVIKSNMPVLVDFWASWCGPCKMVAPIISQIAEEYNGKVKVCKVNVDDQGELAAQNAIVSIPTVILFIDGKPVKKIIGAHSLDDYEDAIDELFSTVHKYSYTMNIYALFLYDLNFFVKKTCIFIQKGV